MASIHLWTSSEDGISPGKSKGQSDFTPHAAAGHLQPGAVLLSLLSEWAAHLKLILVGFPAF